MILFLQTFVNSCRCKLYAGATARSSSSSFRGRVLEDELENLLPPLFQGQLFSPTTVSNNDESC